MQRVCPAARWERGIGMRYRKLGSTGLEVSEIGFGPEWMKGTPEETREIAEACREGGMNLLDCWMSDPHIRDNLGYAMRGHTDEWIVQGHLGASVLAGAPAHAFFGQRTYCGHCQPCVVGIDIAAVNKFADLAKMQDEVPPSVRAHYEALPATAADCIGCASCEPNCPFGVPIAARMAETAELFA